MVEIDPHTIDMAGHGPQSFKEALTEANQSVEVALNHYCESYPYTGSSVVGERLAVLGYPDHICAAAELVCEFADEAGCDPATFPTQNSVVPEHLAAALGWFMFDNASLRSHNLPAFVWTDGRNCYLPQSHVGYAHMAGIHLNRPRPCGSFLPAPDELPVDPPAQAVLFTVPYSHQPIICVLGDMAYADPVQVLPQELVPLTSDGTAQWTAMVLAGLPVGIRSTGGDGMFLGVAVDSGRILRFPWRAGHRRFRLKATRICIR